MPTDNKRLAVPEKSTPYQLYIRDRKSIKSLLNEKGERHDGRKPQTLRPMFLKTDAVPQAVGSSYIEVGNTKVICSVYGPREIPKRDDFSMNGCLSCEFKFATFSEKIRRGHQQDSQEKDLSLLLQETLQPAVLLHTFPKSQVDVNITVLSSGGSTLAAATTAASVALTAAGIEMRDVVVGAAAVICRNDQSDEHYALVDPTDEEESFVADPKSQHGTVILGYMPTLRQVAGFQQNGALSLAAIHDGLATCIESAEKLLPLLRKKIIENVEG